VSEGDYVVYRTEYSESYGLFGTAFGGKERHSILVFSEVDKNGTPTNHGHVFELYSLEPQDDYMGGVASPAGLPTTVPYYYDY
jgi:hypothetical protein